MLTISTAPANSVLPSGNPIWFKVTTDSPLTSTLRLIAVVYFRPSGGSFAELTTLTLAYSSAATTVFDIHETLAAALPVKPINYYNSQTQDISHIGKFYISFYEIEVPDPTPLADPIDSSTYVVVRASLNFIQGSEASNFDYQTKYSLRFLSDMPRIRTITQRQPIAFSYANFDTETADIFVRLLVSWKDGHTETLDTEHVGAYGVLNSHIFDEEYFVELYSESTITRISASLISVTGEVESVMDNFIFVYKSNQRARHFIYLNNLGGLDFITCTGLLDQSFSNQSDKTQNLITVNDYGSQDASIIESNFQVNTKYKVNTGMKSRGEIDVFLSFFYSPQTLLFIKNELEEGSKFWYYPVTKKIDSSYRKDKDYTNALTFEFQIAQVQSTQFPL